MTNIHLPKVIAHRGASAYAPENTLIAFKRAHALNVLWVEFDVKLTNCRQLIIFHDSTLDRTTNRRGAIRHLSLDDIKTLDAGSWFADEFAGEPVPTLDEAIQSLATWQMSVNIEIKPCQGRDIETAEAVVEYIQNSWPVGMTRPLVSSLSIESLRAVRRNDRTVDLALIAHRWPSDWNDLKNELSLFSIHLNHRGLNAERVSLLQNHGLKVLAYTVNHPRRATQLFRWGVDAIFSDRPDKIITP